MPLPLPLRHTFYRQTACSYRHAPDLISGHADLTVVDQMIELALAAGQEPVKSRELSPEAWRALRYAMARLAVDLVSGPAGLAAHLRTQLLDAPWNTPSLPLDIGYAENIPAHIRRAVLLRDRRCAWPRCGRPAAWCDVHHIRHKKHGGTTSNPRHDVADVLLAADPVQVNHDEDHQR